MFGSIAHISSTYVFMFILFGAFLVRSGAGDFIINIARAVDGRSDVRWKLSKGLYIVPLLFAYTPFLSGDWVPALGIFLFGTAGLFALAGALEGYLEVPVSWAMRARYTVIGPGLLWPAGWIVNFGFLTALLVVMVLSIRLHRERST